MSQPTLYSILVVVVPVRLFWLVADVRGLPFPEKRKTLVSAPGVHSGPLSTGGKKSNHISSINALSHQGLTHNSETWDFKLIVISGQSIIYDITDCIQLWTDLIKFLWCKNPNRYFRVFLILFRFQLTVDKISRCVCKARVMTASPVIWSLPPPEDKSQSYRLPQRD